MGHQKPGKTAPQTKAEHLVKFNPSDGPFWVAEADAERPVYYAPQGPASKESLPTRTLIELFVEATKKKGNKVALRTENLNTLAKGKPIPAALPLKSWKSWTWKQYLADVRKGARALMTLGVEQHDTVSIFGFNAPEWLISEIAAMFAGAKASGIYPQDTPDQIQYKSFHSNTSVAVVDTEESLNKYLEVVEDLPYLKALVCWQCNAPESGFVERSDGTRVKVLEWNKFLELANAEGSATDEDLDARIANVKSTHCAALIYTSGTTGRPKAVMISHDNLVFEGLASIPLLGICTKAEEERMVSYLPLSHIAGMLFDVIAPIAASARTPAWMSTNFARGYDLKAGSIAQRLGCVQPTVFLGVPRVWEKIADKLKAIGAETKGLKKKLSTTAKKKGLQYQINLQLGGSGKTPSTYGLYKVLLNVIKKKLGLNQMKIAVAGAAPMPMELLSYFGSVGININEAYGMSESTGAATLSTNQYHEWGTVGFEVPGTETKCFKVAEDGTKTECPRTKNPMNPSGEEQGELCYRGRHIMMGYLANAKLGEEHVAEIMQKNKNTIDEDGWLHSGDKGCISDRGMVRVTGRYKELIIGAGGENIAPVPIEDKLKELMPFVSNVMMHGDKKKFNVVLMTLKCQGANGDLPGTDVLDGPARKWGKTIADATSNPDFIAAVTKALKDTAADGSVTPSRAAAIQKFTILGPDFSIETGELTPTQKLKRSVVEQKHQALIDAMYEQDGVFVPFSAGGSKMDCSNEQSADPAPSGSFKMESYLDSADSPADEADLRKELEAAEADLDQDPAQIEA